MDLIYRKGVEFFDSVRAEADPRTRNWLLVHDTPVYVWMCSIMYLLIVQYGPIYMKHRPAYNLRGFMIIYNSALVLLSVYMVHEIWWSVYENSYGLICATYNSKEAYKRPSELRMAKALWWYFFSKLIEFTDTLLMILRKKNDQITFLHVFHHVSMLNIWWFSIMLIPGGQSWFASSLNSLVHVFMYTYYLLNLFPSARPYLWWKRYITQLQLFQFVMILMNTSYIYLTGCEFPRWGCVMLISYMFIMLGLFGNFYIKAYVKGRRNKLQKTEYQTNGGYTDGFINDDNIIKKSD